MVMYNSWIAGQEHRSFIKGNISVHVYISVVVLKTGLKGVI